MPRGKSKKPAPLFINYPSISCLCAEPKSGKSHLIKYMIYNATQENKYFDYVVVFTMTPEDYTYVDGKYVHTNFTEDKLKKIMRLQKRFKEQGRNINALLVFDDVIGTIKFEKPLFTELNSRYRHYNLSIYYTTQYPTNLPQVLKNCATYAMVFRQTNVYAIRSLYTTFGTTSFKTMELFTQCIETACVNFAFLLIHKMADEMKGEKKVRVCRAPQQIPDFYVTPKD